MSDTKVIETPANNPKCPECGTPLPTGALAGLCPACLLKLGASADTVTDAKQPPFNPPPIAELTPLFPQLEILELIGKGGMGAVYKARQKQLDRVVALPWPVIQMVWSRSAFFNRGRFISKNPVGDQEKTPAREGRSSVLMFVTCGDVYLICAVSEGKCTQAGRHRG